MAKRDYYEVATPATRKLKKNSRKQPRRTTYCVTRRSANNMINLALREHKEGSEASAVAA